jgi:hypothetical protein
MLLAAVLLDAFHAGLEDTEEAFDGVRGDEALRDHGLETMPVTTDGGCGAALRCLVGRSLAFTPRFAEAPQPQGGGPSRPL